MRWRLFAGLAAIIASLAPQSDAAAAVRQCYPTLVAEAAHPTSELEARRKALADWTAAAKKLGDGFTRWQLADERRLACERAKPGGWICRASGKPCTISQDPRRPLPTPPGLERRKGIDA